MRTLLLFISVVSLLTLSSCSNDEALQEITQAEKEQLVKQTIVEFNKSAVKTGNYEVFIRDLTKRTKTTELSQSELEILLQDFLSQQSVEFKNLYYQLESLNLTATEFYGIADQFEYLRTDILKSLKSSSETSVGCETIGAGSFLTIFINWVTDCENP